MKYVATFIGSCFGLAIRNILIGMGFTIGVILTLIIMF